MTTITLDDQVINAVLSVTRTQNVQEAALAVLNDYVNQHRDELPLFDKLRLTESEAVEALASIFERDRDCGSTVEL